MATYRVFLNPEALLEADRLTLDSKESHHLVRVLRAQTGESVEVLDGQGKRYLGCLTKAEGRAAEIRVESVESLSAPKPEVTLIQSVPKGKAMDLILRMATEIGAARIVPVFTDQGEVQIKGNRLAKKVEKWRATMIEACKQCGLPFLPKLEAPVDLKTFLKEASMPLNGIGVVASLEGRSRPLGEVLAKAGPLERITVAVGPEGDFTNDEYAALSQHGFQPVRLGRNVLRAETAAAYILSVVDQYTTEG